jgi:hypothetical protein
VDELLLSTIKCPAGWGIRQIEIQTAEPFVPELSISELEVAIGKLKSYKLPGADQIPAELIKAGGKHYILRSTNLLSWNKELPHQWKEPIVISIHKKGDKTECSNYWGISLLPTSYKILSNILLSRLIPYADEIIWDHQCGFRRNRSTTGENRYYTEEHRSPFRCW